MRIASIFFLLFFCDSTSPLIFASIPVFSKYFPTSELISTLNTATLRPPKISSSSSSSIKKDISSFVFAASSTASRPSVALFFFAAAVTNSSNVNRFFAFSFTSSSSSLNSIGFIAFSAPKMLTESNPSLANFCPKNWFFSISFLPISSKILFLLKPTCLPFKIVAG